MRRAQPTNLSEPVVCETDEVRRTRAVLVGPSLNFQRTEKRTHPTIQWLFAEVTASLTTWTLLQVARLWEQEFLFFPQKSFSAVPETLARFHIPLSRLRRSRLLCVATKVNAAERGPRTRLVRLFREHRAAPHPLPPPH